MRFWRTMTAMLLIAFATAARADVTVTFWSHEMDKNYPHAFITLTGTTEAGKPVNANFGFTAKSISPSILWGPVKGEIETLSSGYLKRSQRRASLIVSEKQYGAILSVVARWKSSAGNSYDLNKRNCIHFVGQIAETLGLRVSYDPSLTMKPYDFVSRLIELNPSLKPVK
jgi:hypothetical protein